LRPSCVYTACNHHVELNTATNGDQIPAEKIDSRECHILSADHEGDQNIAQYSWRNRHEEEEDHDDAMYREQFVIGIRRDEIAGGS
jgi:hypothetical protein